MTETPIPVHEVERHALAATVESQNVAQRARTVVPMPQFCDPSNPTANSGSINMELSMHPVKHSPDYGGDANAFAGRYGTMDDGAPQGSGAAPVEEETPVWPDDLVLPDESDNKDVWEDTATKLGLSKGGTKAEIMERVEDYKRAADAAADEQ